MPRFDWHSGAITRATPIDASYRNTQNVRRFFKAECGEAFRFDRSFMAWLKSGTTKTMGDAADEWRRRETAAAGLARSALTTLSGCGTKPAM